MANQAKRRGGKGAPKLQRIAKHKAKYAMQYRRTFRNKVRRVRQHNGEAAARAYELRGVPTK